MDLTREDKQRDEFRKILIDLMNPLALEKKSDRCNMYKRLEKLYYSPEEEKAFRHFYSDIFRKTSGNPRQFNCRDESAKSARI